MSNHLKRSEKEKEAQTQTEPDLKNECYKRCFQSFTSFYESMYQLQ